MEARLLTRTPSFGPPSVDFAFLRRHRHRRRKSIGGIRAEEGRAEEDIAFRGLVAIK